MKKMKNILFITAAAVLFVLFSCDNQILSEPQLPGSGGNGGSAPGRGILAPDGVRATHGEKRNITVSWNGDPNASRYYIYNSESPLNAFARCAETTETRFDFSVPPGKTAYYRVSSVTHNGEESAQSSYVAGSSLAQPLITDIADITESSSTVTWYMENVSDRTYKADLRYTVYCFLKGAETPVSQIALDGSQLTENKAGFSGLLSGKEYTYQVEAYLVYDQSASEKSEVMDKETARRFRPAAPVNLRASRGTATDEIKVSFELPEMVNIALTAVEIEQHGLYFVISRKFGNNEYDVVCEYFGAKAETGINSANITNDKKTHFDGTYDFGKTVVWIDTNVSRDVEYKYKVQSFVDGTPRTLTSDESKAEATGWALAVGKLSLGDPDYTLDAAGALYAGAELPLIFNFDPKGEEYRYKVLETVKPIDVDENDKPLAEGERDENDPDAQFSWESAFLNYEQMSNYRATMNLTQKSTVSTPGRGLYSYQVKICLPDSGTPVDTLTAIGDVQITEQTSPIVLDGFWIQDGYTDKFRIRWNNYPQRKYILFASADGISWTTVKVYNPTPSTNETENYTVRTENVTTDDLAGCYSSNKPVYFAMQPVRVVTANGGFIDKKGQRKYSDDCRTLGKPEKLTVIDRSYSTLTVAWDEAQKADTYRIKYTTASGTGEKEIEISRSALSLTADRQLKYSFKPEGDTIDVTKAGTPINVKVEALNRALQAVVLGETGTNVEIKKVSEPATGQLVGPANLAPAASKAASADSITVSWDKIDGAKGYYVFRRQFNMDNTAQNGNKPEDVVAYYIPAREDNAIPIKGKNMEEINLVKEDTATVKANASFSSSRFTLEDKCITYAEYTGGYAGHIPAYRNQQNELEWGLPYRYFVVPVTDENHFSNIIYNGGNTYKINDVTYTNPSGLDLEQTGFTIGFGRNVVATKGTFASSGNVNNGIKITWELPATLKNLSGFDPRYTLYRRESGGGDSDWEPVTSNEKDTVYTQYGISRGIAYEYAVGIKNATSTTGGSNPSAAAAKRFIDDCYTKTDEKGRPKMLGFMLDMVKMDSVSRNEQNVGSDFAEEVKWKSAGIKNRTGAGNKWGIDGYEVWVMNRNLDCSTNGGWRKIVDIPYDKIDDQTDQRVKVTNVAGGNTEVNGEDKGVKIIEGGLLKVMRDYKHFFKVRSYVLSDPADTSSKIYSPDPSYTYTHARHDSSAYNDDPSKDPYNTEYVMWGARQVTPTEMVKIATLIMAWGIDQTGGGSTWNWQSTIGGYTLKTTNNGSSGEVYTESSSGVGMWWFDFKNYKPDLDLYSNKGDFKLSVTFVTIDTNSNMNGSSTTQTGRTIFAESNGAGSRPNFYGYLPSTYNSNREYGKDYFDVKGPLDVPSLYTAKMRFNSDVTTNVTTGVWPLNKTHSCRGFKWGSDNNAGYVEVLYPGTAATSVKVYGGQINTPLAFNSQSGSSRRNNNEWY